jgi:O-antigen/teichoic acid export membrane protein
MTWSSLSFETLWSAFRTKVIRRKFVQDVGVLTAANLAGAALNFVQGILVARWLGPENYGVAALIMTYPGLLFSIFDARSHAASVKFVSEFHARGQRDHVLAMCKVGYGADLAVAVLAFLTVVVTADWASERILQRSDAMPLMLAYAGAFIPQALGGTSYAVLSALGRFALIARLTLATTALRVSLVLALVWSGYEVAGIVWGNAIGMAAAGAAYGAVAYSAQKRAWGSSWLRGQWRILQGRRREIVGFLAYNNVVTLLGTVPNQLDVLLLGYFRNPTEVGYYKLARSIAEGLRYLVGPLQSVTYPRFARLWASGDSEALARDVRRCAIRVGIPLGCIALAGIPLVTIMLPILVGQAYLPAIAIAMVLMAGSSVWLFLFWLRPCYFAMGNIASWTTTGALSAGVFLPVLPLIAWRWGYLGVTWWSVCMTCFSASVALFRLRQFLSSDQ